MDKPKPAVKQAFTLRIEGWYGVFRAIVGFLLRVLSRFEVEGLEHIPSQGPYLLVTNHLHWLDPPALMVAYPHRTHVFAAEKWEHHWFMGPLMRSMDAIFVQRGEVDRKALSRALAVLEGGGVLGLAPEGTRSKTGGLQRGRSGAGYMAARTGCQVVPAVATGQEKVFPTLKRLRRAQVRIRFGPAIEPPRDTGGRPPGAVAHTLTQEIMYCLAAMLPAEYRGVYADVAERRPDLMARYGRTGANPSTRS